MTIDLSLVFKILPGEKYAIKECKNINPKDKEMFEKEANLVKPLQHKNIVQYISHFEHKKILYIVLEFCNDGDLSNKINRRKKFKKELDVEKYEYIDTPYIENEMKQLFSNKAIKDCLIEIVEGLQYLHHGGIFHRDLKPQNVLISKSYGNLTFKIADFGLSKTMEATEGTKAYVTSAEGTKIYMSPEALSDDQKSSFPSDVWAVGCMLYELW